MAIVHHIAIVDESDYPALASLCVRSVVCDDYNSYLLSIELDSAKFTRRIMQLSTLLPREDQGGDIGQGFS